MLMFLSTYIVFACDFSHGNVVQLPREEVIINNKRVVALIDSGCSRSIVSAGIVSHLGLKPAMNHVITISGDKIKCGFEKEVNVQVRDRNLTLS